MTEPNFKISDLTLMAQNFIDKYKIDKDNSGTINTDQELNKLLTGTLAGSIEELTYDNVHEKLINSETEKIFTAMMTSKTIQENWRTSASGHEVGCPVLDNAKISTSHVYDNLTEFFYWIDGSLQNISELYLDMLTNIKDKNSDYASNIVEKVQAFLNTDMKALDNVYSENWLPNQDLRQEIQQQKDFLNSMIETIKALPTSDNEAYIEQINNMQEKISNIKNDIKNLTLIYNNQKKNDEDFFDKLYKYYEDFTADDIATPEEEEKAKDLLKELINNASPIARSIVLQYAENSYNNNSGEKNITGIDETDNKLKIKRSSYKTATEIYVLRRDTVYVSDYIGRILRTEQLDPTVHAMFFE